MGPQLPPGFGVWVMMSLTHHSSNGSARNIGPVTAETLLLGATCSCLVLPARVSTLVPESPVFITVTLRCVHI